MLNLSVPGAAHKRYQKINFVGELCNEKRFFPLFLSGTISFPDLNMVNTASMGMIFLDSFCLYHFESSKPAEGNHASEYHSQLS
jgi:hypothetical protein